MWVFILNVYMLSLQLHIRDQCVLCLWFHIDILYAYSICDVCDLHIYMVYTLSLCFHILDRNKVYLLTHLCSMCFCCLWLSWFCIFINYLRLHALCGLTDLKEIKKITSALNCWYFNHKIKRGSGCVLFIYLENPMKLC